MDWFPILIILIIASFIFTRQHYLFKIKDIERYTKQQIDFFYTKKSIQELSEKIAKDVSEIEKIKFENKTYYYTNTDRFKGEFDDIRGFTVEDNWYSLSMKWYLWRFGDKNSEYKSIKNIENTEFAFYSERTFEVLIASNNFDYKKFIVENHKDGDAEYISYEEALRIKEKMPRKPRLNPY